jgi:DedD protein
LSPDLKGTPEIPARPSAAGPETKVVVSPVAKLDAPDKNKAASEAPKDVAPPPAKEPVTPFSGEPLKPVAPARDSAEAPGAKEAVKPAPAADKPKATKAPPSEKADKADGAAPKSWIVQVGVYSNPENAARVESKLKSHGHTVREERIKIATGTAVRLRIGPYRDKAVAQKARDQVEKDTGEKAAVVPYP